MTKEEVTTKVLGILNQYHHDVEVTPSCKLKNDLQMDSLDQIEFSMNLEKEFNIIIPDADLYDIETVDHAIDCVMKHLSTISNV